MWKLYSEHKYFKLANCRQIISYLSPDMFGQWARYHTELGSLNQVLSQTEYALNHYILIGGDISTLQAQVEKLKVSCLFYVCVFLNIVMGD